ncbi:MAG: transketolase [Deltaproteobacteria bacterium]|nr:transketolase [Deltaproteobacteria bacterium]
MTKEEPFEQKCINTIRFLAADAVEKAKSGHPGMPMGAAAMAYTLWRHHLKHNPANPQWVDRDRVVLSAGHASMLLYAMLHLTGYDVSLDDIKDFRQWGSKTPGHPERHHPPGCEVTTGPLGQGLATAVGMAVAEAHLAAKYNRPRQNIVNHFTYVLASDGDMMEGVTAEACSLAGHLGLGKLIVLYDENGVCLAGSTALSFTEDVGRRFEAYGWHVQKLADGNDTEAIDKAIEEAKGDTERPSVICIRTTIGYGAPHKQETSDAHGSPLGPDELLAAKKQLGWPAEPAFLIPEDVSAHLRECVTEGKKREQAWKKIFGDYAAKNPDSAREFQRIMAGQKPEGWEDALPVFPDDSKDIATRKASEGVLQALAHVLPELMGGSADLNPSTFTWLKGLGDFQKPGSGGSAIQGTTGSDWSYTGRNIHFGVREHAMAAVVNGMAIHGGFIPYASTFLTFCDYMRPSMRLAALMGLPVIYVFTHDSIGLGEDGPTHQPIEQVMNLRAVPNLTVIRPADANETVEAWRCALQNQTGPTALILTRQNLPVIKRSEFPPATGLRKGGYSLWDSSTILPQLIILATGSEVSIALEAAQKLFKEGIRVRVVSLPSWELFELQPAEYRESVLPASVRARISVEAGVRIGWERHVGFDGLMVGMDGFGASAPAKVLFEKFGFTAEKVAALAKTLIK